MMQAIDSTIPFESRRARQRKAGIHAGTDKSVRRGQSIDGVLPRRLRKQPVSRTQASPIPQETHSRSYHSLDPARPKTPGLKIARPHASLKRNVVIGLLVGLGVVGLTVIAHQPLGLVLVVGYGAMALLRRIPARVTFTIALIAIVLVPLSLLLLGGRNVVTSAFASYGFLLFATGVVTLWRDLRQPANAN